LCSSFLLPRFSTAKRPLPTMRAAAKLLLTSALLAGASATEVNSKAEWEDVTSGKSVFVKFLAPW